MIPCTSSSDWESSLFIMFLFGRTPCTSRLVGRVPCVLCSWGKDSLYNYCVPIERVPCLFYTCWKGSLFIMTYWKGSLFFMFVMTGFSACHVLV